MKAQPSTPVKIGVTEVRNHFADLLKRVHRSQEHLIVEKGGIPVAAIIGTNEYDEFLRWQAGEALQPPIPAVAEPAQDAAVDEESPATAAPEERETANPRRFEVPAHERTLEPSTSTLSGKTCLVTGAARGLGAVIARTLAAQGATVVVHYNHSTAQAISLCAELEAAGATAVPLQADLLDADAIETLVADVTTQLGPIDILVNNVGPYVDTPLLGLPLADFDRVMAGNVRATFLLSQLVGRDMRARGSGHIVNLAATDYRHRSHSVYGLAKSGVVYLTEALALELAPTVACFAVAPDLIADNEDMTDDFVARAVAATPIGRLVTRAEVATMVALLCTPACAMLTGQTVIMDGGRSIPRMAQ